MRAKQVTMFFAQRGLMSSTLPWSTTVRMSLYMSYDCRVLGGSRSSRASSLRSIGSSQAITGGFSPQCEGMYDR